MDNAQKYAAALQQIFSIAELHHISLSAVEFSNDSRGGYIASNDGKVALVWANIEVIGAKLPDSTWCQFSMDGGHELTVRNIAAWTGQVWWDPPPPAAPDPSVADPSPLKNTTGQFIGGPTSQPGQYSLNFPLPEGSIHVENGKAYRIVGVPGAFGGKSFVAELLP